MVEKDAITPNGLHYGRFYYKLSPEVVKVKPEIDSYLCGYCEGGRHHFHVAITMVGRCKCLVCREKSS